MGVILTVSPLKDPGVSLSIQFGYRMQELAYGGLSMETKNFLIREDISGPKMAVITAMSVKIMVLIVSFIILRKGKKHVRTDKI